MNIQEVTLNFKNNEGKVTPVTFKVPHGISINPKGTIETADLLTNLSPEFGDAYLINTGNSEGCLFIYAADNYPTDLCKGSWVNLGKIRGEKGDNGLSAYELWKLTQPACSDTSLDTFLQSLKGETGQSFYDWWVDEQPDDADTSKEAFQLAMKGAKGDAGADMVAGDFLSGFTITNKNQQAIYRNGDDTLLLLWGGVLPKTVPAGSTPQSTGGIGKSAWISIGDEIKANTENYIRRAETAAEKSEITASFVENMSQTIISLNSGQEFFLTEAELLATIPSKTGHVAKALDTKKVWIFKKINIQQSITVSPVSGASANTYPENPSAISPGEDRAYFRINVQNIESMTVSGARTDLNWTWVFRDADLAPVLFSTFKGNGTVSVPSGSVWAYRTYKTSRGEEYSTMSIVADVRTGESAWEDTGLSELDLAKSYTDKRIENALSGENEFQYTIIPINGAAASTNPGIESPIAAGEGRAYIRLDVQGVEVLTVSGARTDLNWTWVFRNENLEPVLFSTFKGNGTVSVPPGSVWAYRTYKTPGGEENSEMSIVGERIKTGINKRLDDIINDISDLSSMISKLEFDMSPDGSRISPNDFEGDTQDERIRNALAYIKRRGWGVLELGIDTVSPVQTSTWTISSALLIPSNCWLYLNHSKLKLANGVFDNIIRNDGIVPSSDPFLVATALNENVNIRIFGTGTDSAFIEGPDVPYTAPHPINGGTAIPWVGDFYGWRTIPILLANVKNYKIHDFHISKTTCWAISQEHGCDNFEIFNIDFKTTVKNGDGIDVRMGCKNGRIYGISGVTLDDTIALSALNKEGVRVYPDGNYIYPMQVGGYADRGFGIDIENVRIWNVRARGEHNGVRLLNSGRSKLKNIVIDDVADSGGSYGVSIVNVSTGYGVASVMGDTVGISINKVTSTYSNTPITLDGPIQDSQINAIYQAKASGVLIKNTATLKNTTVTNIKRI